MLPMHHRGQLLREQLALARLLIAKVKREAEHKMEVEYNGDFRMADFLRHLHRLGAIGASRDVHAFGSNDEPVKFGWDGDGAAKIIAARVDGKDVLKIADAIKPRPQAGLSEEVQQVRRRLRTAMTGMKANGELSAANRAKVLHDQLAPRSRRDVVNNNPVENTARIERLIAQSLNHLRTWRDAY